MHPIEKEKRNMYILPINNYNNNYSNTRTNNISFKSCNRIYRSTGLPKEFGDYARLILQTKTSFFRNGLDWPNIPEILMTNFKDKPKVNFYCLACSDGSEPLSYGMLILDKIPKEIQSKFLTIKASDIDGESIKAAKSGLINVTDDDIATISRNVDISINDMFSYQKDCLRIEADEFARKPEYQDRTYKIKGELANTVEYEQADSIDVIKNIDDDGNTIISCRNVFFYFSKDYRQRFFETLNDTLKRNSLFVIGQNDIMGDAHKYLQKIGFTEIAQNVYRKN